ncbi:MAG: type I-E CRISPR-associated protein Cas6/Cse3/CasE [Gammaproteobacteria bacterium]|nr:type I-E CRISPR-associated protein Cas6/Cse3/CasE [Gammaproteobacteria bacterium]MYJ52032.1 type I-E CRISPR-associated protein Cas6/Cse3/CasE [Gammaproteobacteria bacterium]
MRDLHLVGIPVDLRQLHHWGVCRSLTCNGYLDEGLALHHVLDECFGRAVLQPFRLMVPHERRQGKVFAYAALDSVALDQTARAVATPDLLEVIDLDKMQSVPRPASAWREGQRLGFDLRIRSVVRLAKPIKHEGKHFRQGAEVDAWLSHVLAGGTADREALYLDWLDARLDGAAKLERQASKMAQFRRSTAVRSRRMTEGPEVVIHGTLSVRDSGAFFGKLTQGVGRHRAYGYGMILLRPPQGSC